MHPLADKDEEAHSFDRQLFIITSYIENEIARKEVNIRRLEIQLNELNNLVKQKDGQLKDLLERVAECQHNVEGQRQLVNKLLDDIGSYQRDLLWYRRTYEQRSLMGILKDKFFGKNSNSGNDKP